METEFLTARLIFEALKKRVLMARKCKDGYESLGFFITYAGGEITIRNGDKKAGIRKDTNPLEEQVGLFRMLLKDFLSLSFPKN